MDLRGAIDLHRNSHDRSDVDQLPTSLHHTLGSSPNQAAPGMHIHPASQLPIHAGAVYQNTAPGATQRVKGSLWIDSSGTDYLNYFNGSIWMPTRMDVANVDQGANDLLVVHKASNESISGVKSFTNTTNMSTVNAGAINASGVVAANAGLTTPYHTSTDGWFRSAVSATGIYNSVNGTGIHHTATGVVGTYPDGSGAFCTAQVVGPGGGALNLNSNSCTIAVRTNFQNAGHILRITPDAADGNVGVGIFSGSFLARFLKNGSCGGTGAYVTISDKRAKNNIKPLKKEEKSLDKIRKIVPKSFTYKNRTATEIGFVAQEIQEIIPEAVSVFVHDDPDQMLGLQTDAILAHAVQAIQELTVMVEELQKKVQAG